MRWMVALSVATWTLLVAIAGRDFVPELTAGMAGPLVVVTTSWWLIARTHRTNPAGVTHVLLSAFIGKALFFAAYVIVVVQVLGVRPVPFILAFTGYFVALYATQAMLMRRLFESKVQASA